MKQSARPSPPAVVPALLYLLRAVLITAVLAWLWGRSTLAGLTIDSHEYMLKLVCQLDVYRALFYALLPATALVLLLPAGLLRAASGLRLILIALVLGAAAGLAIWLAPALNRPGLSMSGLPRFGALCLGLNLAGLVWLHAGSRWTERLRRLVLWSVPLSDLLFPALVCSAMCRGAPRFCAVLRLLPAGLLAGLCLAPWLSEPISTNEGFRADPALRRIMPASDVFYQVQVDPRDGALLLADEGGALVRFDPRSGRRTELRSAHLEHVQALALDRETGLLLAVCPDGYSLAIDATTLEIRREQRLEGSLGRVKSGLRTMWDQRSGLLAAASDQGPLSLCQDGRSIIGHQVLFGSNDSLLDPRRSALHVLTGALLQIRLHDLSTRRRLPVPRQPDRLAYDERNDALLISLPVQAGLMSVSAEDYAPLRRAPAFPGVRALAVDQQRRILICAGFSPLIEARSLDDLSLIDRFAAPQWSRWIELDAPRGRAYITTCGNGVWELDLNKLGERSTAGRWRRIDPFYALAGAAVRAIATRLGWEQPQRVFYGSERKIISRAGDCPPGVWTDQISR